MQFVIRGRMASKKNSKQIGFNRRTKRRFIRSSDQWKAYEKHALWQLRAQKWAPTITENVHVCALYYPPDRKWELDTLAVYEGVGDLLQDAGIIANDRQIKSWDGSRIMEPDKTDPRVEITIEEMEGSA